MILLEQVGKISAERGYKVVNTDATLIAEQPKLAPYIDKMKQNIAKALGIAVGQVNVKATTTETLGFTGREEGLAAQAVVMIEKS